MGRERRECGKRQTQQAQKVKLPELSRRMKEEGPKKFFFSLPNEVFKVSGGKKDSFFFFETAVKHFSP